MTRKRRPAPHTHALHTASNPARSACTSETARGTITSTSASACATISTQVDTSPQYTAQRGIAVYCSSMQRSKLVRCTSATEPPATRITVPRGNCSKWDCPLANSNGLV